ncbi:MAG: hypothetical protein JWM33_139 [Caulobacteraceae bacterium]|nr:hypothetical protein [Caulobacteraceae bacterium]
MFQRLSLVKLTPLAAVSTVALLSLGAAPLEKAPLKSASAISFAPNGVLLVGDSLSSAVYAFPTNDTRSVGTGAVRIDDLSGKAAALLGVSADQVSITDLAVNPASGAVYIAVNRGTGADATPVILRADRSGVLTDPKLNDTSYVRAMIGDAPAAAPAGGRGPSTQSQTITDLGFAGGKVLVAGLSNEAFNSSMRTIAYPFTGGETKGAGIEIFHDSHNRFETNAPVRTFLAYDIGGKPSVLAAYTCTPLVKLNIDDLKPGASVHGTTISELGAGNQPLDMIPYAKDGKNYLLLSNSARGVMKIDASHLESYQPITTAVPEAETRGAPYTTIADLKGVQQLDKLDDARAVIIVADAGKTSLQTVGLP